MSILATANEIIQIETKKIAEQIFWEVRRECPKKSGRTARSFYMEKRDYGWAIVSDKLTAYYAENGNGGPGTLIYPTHSKLLKITNGVNKTLGYAPYVRGYDGAHFLQKIAERHNS